jgi:hypothetical protein
MAMALNMDKLVKVMARMSSDQDGEALNALRRTQAMLAEDKMSFVDVANRFRQSAGKTSADFDDRDELISAAWKARMDAAQARQETEQAKRETAWAKQQANWAKQEIERLKQDAEWARQMVEQARQNAERGKTVADRRATVIAMIQDPANMGRSDRNIAATVGVSPQIVGNLRRKLGIGLTTRNATRQGRNGHAQ